jgi:mannose-6-phosphate isomerase
MFVGITNVPRDYAWGSDTAIAELLGTDPSGAPEAELWLGTHPGSPARLVEGGDLSDVVPERLPFLLKVLAAASPLSLQAHPTMAQAAEGFERENAAGVPLDAPHRNYKDPFHKPELIVALSETFDALSGFRPVDEVRRSLEQLSGEAVDDFRARLTDDSVLPAVFEWLITRGDGVDELVAEVVAGAAAPEGLEFGTVRALAEAYPGDPGIVLSLLLHRVRLNRGEALYLPAGNIHAYLEGLGIELMAASDNVLRGGLTPKHVDVPELLRVLDFTPRPVPYLEPEQPAGGVRIFRPDVPEFALAEVTVADGSEARVPLPGPAIALCTDGDVRLSGASGDIALTRGAACFISADEGEITVSGAGTVFVATTNPTG